MRAHRRLACVLFATGISLASSGVSAAVLGPGYTLAPDQRLYSLDRKYFATLGGDGDFGVYRTADGMRTWSTGTRGSGAISANMLRDGRFILVSHDGHTVWSTPTRGRHRVFGVSSWGAAVVLNARKWKPRDKVAEPFVEHMLSRRARLDWQTPAAESPAITRRRLQAQAPPKAKKDRHAPRTTKVARP
jgi:hypothetical protein